MTRRLRDAGHAIGDLARDVGRRTGGVGRGAGRFAIAAWSVLRDWWLGLSIYTRRRIGVAAGIVALITVIVVFAVPSLPCEAPGGDECPPVDDAIELVPADVLAYAHVNLDQGSEQFQRAEEVASRVPAIASQVTSRLLARLPGPTGTAPEFGSDIEPWFGGEAALAVIPAGAGAAEEVELLEVDEQEGARRYARSIAAGNPQTTTYRDLPVRVDRRGLATAVVGGFMAIGSDSGVRDVIDAHSGAEGAETLADDPAARAAREGLPASRFADAYLSEAGIAELVSRPRGPLATLATLVDPDASTGAAAALVADDEGLEVALRSELDPDRSAAHPGFFSAFPSFRPTLSASLPSDSLGYLGIAEPGEAVKSLLAQARAEEPGLAATAGRLVDRVQRLGGVDLGQDLLPSLGGEAAFALEPAPRGRRSGGKRRDGKGGGGIAPPPASRAGPTPPTAATLRGPGTPYVEFVGSGVESATARRALARLQGPISKALNPSRAGQAPVFVERRIEDVTAHSLRLSPTVDLTYAVDGSVLVVATDPAGVHKLVAGEGGLDDTNLFDRATEGLPDEVSLLGYLNLGGLIALGERAGLAEDPAYATFAPEIRAAEALGLAVRSSPEELATDLRLLVGRPDIDAEEGGVPEVPPVD